MKNYLVFSLITLAVFLNIQANKTFAIETTKISAVPISNNNDSIKLEAIEGWIDHVITYNIGYLGIAVTIIILTGGFGYYLNIKPLQEKINKQEDEFKKSLRHTESRIGNQFSSLISKQRADMKTAEEQLRAEINILKTQTSEYNQALRENIKDELRSEIIRFNNIIKAVEEKSEKKINEVKELAQNLELETIWSEHYMWRYGGVYINELRTLIDYLVKGLIYQKTSLFKLCLGQIDTCLENLIKKSEKINDVTVSDNLEKILTKISGLESEKSTITEKLKSLKNII